MPVAQRFLRFKDRSHSENDWNAPSGIRRGRVIRSFGGTRQPDSTLPRLEKARCSALFELCVAVRAAGQKGPHYASTTRGDSTMCSLVHNRVALTYAEVPFLAMQNM